MSGAERRICLASSMTLYASWVQLADEVDAVVAHLRSYASSGAAVTSAGRFSFQDECLLEGLLSRSWQAWCNFCRSCIVKSCLGTTDGSGLQVVAHQFAFAEEHVSGAAIRAKAQKNKPPYWGNSNLLLRAEPTWGDVDILARVIPRLGCANAGQLTAAFSSCSISAKAIQTIRNASAHHNTQTLAEVLAIRSSYITFPLTHPIQALYWTEPLSGDYLAISALGELVDGGLAAIT